MNRRSFLTGTTTLLGAGVLAACAKTTTPQTVQTISAQILADLQGLQAAAQAVIQVIAQASPNAIPADTQARIDQGFSDAERALLTLSTSTPAADGASALQAAETALQNVLNAIGTVLPSLATKNATIAKVVPIYDAAIAIIPIVLAYVNSLIPATTAGIRPMPNVLHSKYDPAGARAVLHIPTVQ